MNLISDKKGIALLLVLSSLVILTTAIVQFAYTEHINYQLAVNAKERLQAYYLARSAVQFSKVMLVAQKQAETEKAKFGAAAEGYDFEPIYKQYPLSSELMKQAISGELNQLLDDSQGSEETDDTADAGDEDKKDEEEDRPIGDIMDMDAGDSIKVSDAAKEFTNFKGEFLAEISEENAKYDLNKVASLVSTSPSYDQRKKLLQALLMQEKYKDLFENQAQDSEALVHALADWVDQNDTVNEYENIQRGSEDSGDKDYPVKNGKMLTLSEVRLVKGMNDDIFGKLKDFVTVYSGSDKINACVNTDTGEEWIKAMIYHYTHNAGCGRPVDYDDEDKMTELAELVLGFCPDPAAMAQALNGELGLTETTSGDSSKSTSSDSSTSSDTDKSSSSTSASSSASSKVPGCSFQFKDLLDDTNSVFSIKATGTVGDTQLSISTVINASSSDPTKWTYNYYHIE